MDIIIEAMPSVDMVTPVEPDRLMFSPNNQTSDVNIRIGFITAKGAGGAEARGVLYFHTEAGKFSVRMADDNKKEVCGFDKAGWQKPVPKPRGKKKAGDK